MRPFGKKDVNIRTALACLLLSFPFFTIGQMQLGLSVDSLKRALSAMEDDTLKVATLITLAQQYENNHLDSATHYYEAARALSEALGYSRGIVRHALNYSAVLNMQGRSTESVQLLEDVEKLCKDPALAPLRRRVLANIGAAYQYLEQYETAVDYYLRSLPLAEAANDRDMLSILYSNLVGLYRNMRQTGKSMDY